MLNRPQEAAHYHNYSHVLTLYSDNNQVATTEEFLSHGVLNISMGFLYGIHIQEGTSLQNVVHMFLSNFDTKFADIIRQYSWVHPRLKVINPISYQYTKDANDKEGITVSISVVVISHGENITTDMRNMFMSTPWKDVDVFPERCNLASKVMYLKEWEVS